MSNTAVLGRKELKTSQAGRPYCIAWIGGQEYVGFGDTVGHVSRIEDGATVEYTSKPSDKPNGTPVLTYVKATGGTTTQTTPTTQATTTKTTVTQTNDDRTRDIHRQVCWKMAVELIAAGKLRADGLTHQALADLVRTVGDALLDKYENPYSGTGTPPTGDQDPT